MTACTTRAAASLTVWLSQLTYRTHRIKASDNISLIAEFRVVGGQKQAQDFGHDSGTAGNPHSDRCHPQKSFDCVGADVHALRNFLVATSLQQQGHDLLLSVSELELLVEVG